MTKRVQLIRHDNAGTQLFLGKLGELTVNTGNNSVVVHNGTTQGGFEMAKADLTNVLVAAAANAGKMSAQQATELAQALLDIVSNKSDIDADAADLVAYIISNDAAVAQNVTDIGTNTAKLSGIEDGADVTDTANVTAAGALMDSEVDADLKTLSLPANTTISAFGKTLVDDADAAAARTTLGLGGLATKSTVGSAEMQTDSVGADELKTAIGADTSVNVPFATPWVFPAGFYNTYVNDINIARMEFFITGTWRVGTGNSGFVWSDGTNVRMRNNDNAATLTLYYQKLG